MRRCLKSSYKQNVSCILESGLHHRHGPFHRYPKHSHFSWFVVRIDRSQEVISFPHIIQLLIVHKDVRSRKEIAAKPPLSCLCSYGVLRTSCLVICKRQRDSDHITFQPLTCYKVRRNSIREGWSRQCLSLPVPPSTSHLASAFAFISRSISA
jgi:hypothetical protein